MKILKRGAESEIILEKNIITKNRIKKNYRNKEIDSKLRKNRTKYESRILEKLNKLNFPTAKLIEKNDFEIRMEFIKGKTIKEIIDGTFGNKINLKKISMEIGKNIAFLHSHGIIHGDLTTANMILNSENGRIYFVDFGLSFHSDRNEDKAVDLHLLKQALSSAHVEIWKNFFGEIVTNYLRNYGKGEIILKRMEQVEGRGRYK